MSFDLREIRERLVEGPVARVVVAETRGSAPRGPGAAMLVSRDRVTGTIGGGALEHEAIGRARAALEAGSDRLDRRPLGPDLGQCCGGSVTLLTEIWTAERLAGVEGEVVARPLPGERGAMPLAVRRAVAGARSAAGAVRPGIVARWMVEPVSRPSREIWVWGAGHVGRALVAVLAPLPEVAVFWADTDAARFPEEIPQGVELRIAANPADLVTLSGDRAEHAVLTYSHALDLEICHRVLSRSFGWLGLIGSGTKRARFRSRLAALGHGTAQIDRMICPIGDPSLGKHPQAIAIGVAAEMIARGARETGMIGREA